MAESNGLLDLMKSPAAMGLLAAGFGGLAGANRNTPYNNLGRAGLAGIAGYSAADALQQNQAKLDEADRVKKAIPGLYRTGANGQTSFDALEAARMGINPKLIAEYAAVPNAGRAKVKNTIYVPGMNGEKVAIQQDEYGSQVGKERTAYVAPQMVDTGDTKQFVTPQAGQSFQVGMSPSERDAQARGWANVGARNEQNNILREGLDIQEQAQRTQVITMPDGTIQLIDKGTGRAVQPKTPEGNPLPKSAAPVNLTEGEGKASIYLSQMADASRVLNSLPDVSPVKIGATGSAWTNWMAPADAQKAGQAQRQWAESFLRAKTGAAATVQEVEGNIKTFFPVVGDTPEVIKNKAAARAQAEQDMTIPAGRGASRIKPVNAAGNLTNSNNPPAAVGTPVGTVEDGYVFKGGDDTDPSNWERQ